jgi:hypothetical protein
MTALQAPATQLPAAQTTGSLPWQEPAWHESFRVQALPSSHAAPSVFAGLEQAPLAWSQVPGSWHWSFAAQTTGVVPTQVPA